MDASSVPAGREENDPGASAASSTDQGNDDVPPVVLSGRAAHELGSWGRLPPTVRGRARGQSQRLQSESAQRQLAIDDAISAVVYKWTGFGSSGEYILNDGRYNGHGGWKTCRGKK